MNNDIYNIKSLFALGDVQQLVIPEVQRDYVWEEKNCNRLFHSIKHGFDNRKNGMPEYIKLIPDEKTKFDVENKFIEDNSKINLGFIYTYHDEDYNGKLFLIDGQQRFTTIYLLLLACYIKTNRSDEFKSQYFRNNIPKLDYKVRESSHDFIVELINDQCYGNSIDAIEERLWWRPDFYNDITINNLKNNYLFLHKLIEKIPIEELLPFLNYLERNIIFKFYAVPLSEQGEELYLFMNSRGVRLTFQEKIRAEVIAKHGMECGSLWDDVQQFFWIKKLQNVDSELGFDEYLKWSVIIHIAIKNKDFQNYDDYIKRPSSEIQLELLESYIIDYITDFDMEYLKGLFNATKYLFELNGIDAIQYNPEWLTSPDENIMPMRIYLKLLPVIYYIFRKQADGDVDTYELRRVSAFIVNCNQSRTYQKNPQLYLINFIKFIKNLCDNKSLKSIMEFDVNSGDFIGRDFSNLYFRNYSMLKSDMDKSILENFVIKMILDAENNSLIDFLHGDYRVILESIPKGKTMPESIELMKSYIDKLNWFIKLDLNQKRKLLLTFGDYSFELTKIKCDFGQEKISWGDIFTNELKIDIFKNFLNTQFSLDDKGMNSIIDDWLSRNPISSLKGEKRYIYYLIKYNFEYNYFAKSWDENELTIRNHSVRKSGYNSSIDIMNYAVSRFFPELVNNIGWVDGSSDPSVIKLIKNEQFYISMQYVPTDWISGKWELKNMLELTNSSYIIINDLIEKSPQLNVSMNDDIVEVGKKMLEYLIENI